MSMPLMVILWFYLELLLAASASAHRWSTQQIPGEQQLLLNDGRKLLKVDQADPLNTNQGAEKRHVQRALGAYAEEEEGLHGGLCSSCAKCTNCWICSTAAKPLWCPKAIRKEGSRACQICASKCSNCPAPPDVPGAAAARSSKPPQMSEFSLCADCDACAQCCPGTQYAACEQCAMCAMCRYC